MLCTIYKLYKQADEELKGSENYIERAENSKDKEDEKIYYDMANDEMKHAVYLVDMAKRKTEKLSEYANKEGPENLSIGVMDIIKDMHTEYMQHMAKVKELMNIK